MAPAYGFLEIGANAIATELKHKTSKRLQMETSNEFVFMNIVVTPTVWWQKEFWGVYG
jgi:hypothetical protein